GDLGVVAKHVDLLGSEGGARLVRPGVACQHAALESGVEIRPVAGRVGADVGDGQTTDGAAVVLPDDELLGHVDQAASEVPGVGGAQGGVGQALPGAVGG